MEKGKLSFRDIQRTYSLIDEIKHFDSTWVLCEHKIWGEERVLALNATRGYYVYTTESLMYTIIHIDDYTRYKLYE